MRAPTDSHGIQQVDFPGDLAADIQHIILTHSEESSFRANLSAA